uniref:(California timema) hypothetical protein n=1 Tax=Timema californicum TaxID=61474 RepID=A0A7R9J7R9_TIMCA|nr:unnamed protein product [Timema californicum]
MCLPTKKSNKTEKAEYSTRYKLVQLKKRKLVVLLHSKRSGQLRYGTPFQVVDKGVPGSACCPKDSEKIVTEGNREIKRGRVPGNQNTRAEGKVDYQGTMDAIWQSHLEQLVPCAACGRTFMPDRLTVHERSCKGPK